MKKKNCGCGNDPCDTYGKQSDVLSDDISRLKKLAGISEVAGPKDCWDGKAPGAQGGPKTKAGTGKNKGKRVNNCEPIKKPK